MESSWEIHITILQNLLLGSIFKAFTGLVSPLELGSERSPCHLLPSRLDRKSVV